MAFNLFGPATKDDIKVGYISTERGYISNLTICEANQYAKNDPGSRFVFKTRDEIKYLNINQVNGLTPNDLVSAANTCSGIKIDADCGPAQAYFYGGAGVGVQGNPIIGQDGSVLAVDIVHGGFGYQYPPIVEVKDGCGIGAGAVARSVLGEVTETVQYYNQESDFEEYEICDPTDIGYGKRYDPNGKELGDWDPTLYANLTRDPIGKEIEKYQDFLKDFPNPWWTTRKYTPLRVTSGSKVTRTKFNVTDETYRETQNRKGNTQYAQLGQVWSEFMNSYAISPVPPSNAKGSDFAVDLFTFEWEQNFPYDGEYVFTGAGDGEIKDFYLDNIKISQLASYNDSPTVIKKTIKSGVHRIRLDIKNGGIFEKVTTETITSKVKLKFVEKSKKYYIEATGTGSAEATIIMEVNDAFYIAGVAAKEVKIPTDGKKISLKRNEFLPKDETIKKSGRFTAGKTYGPIEIIGADPNAGIPKVYSTKLSLLDTAGKDENIRIIISDIKNAKDSTTTTKTTLSSTISSSDTTSKNVFNTIDYINKADRTLWRTFPSSGKDGDFIHTYGITPVNPNTEESNTNSFAGFYTIKWQNIQFPVDGNYEIEVMVDDNVTLTFTGVDTETTIRKKGYSSPNKSTGKTTETKYFKAGSYTLTANLQQIEGKPLAQGNPMALAINIQRVANESIIVSPKSWNDNPMGISLTIDAPQPPIPQEPIILQEGRCPQNPIWTTRFPTSKEKWYPVRYYGRPKISEELTIDPVKKTQEVEFDVYGQGSFEGLSFVFTSTDGKDSFTLKGVNKNKKTRKEKVKVLKNVTYKVKAFENSAQYTSVEQGLIKNGTKSTEEAVGTSNKIFADYTSTKNDNDDIQVTASLGVFTSSNRRKARNSGRNTYDLVYRYEPAAKNKIDSVTIETQSKIPGWSQFMNRYAISPIPPLSEKNSDGGGVVYRNSWNLDIPYDGFYALKGARDNYGRVLIDGKEISKLNGYNVESPESAKIFLTKGMHNIEVEIENEKTESFDLIDKKIFSTSDWVGKTIVGSTNATSVNLKFIAKGTKYYIEATGSGTAEAEIIMEVNDKFYEYGLAATGVVITSDSKKLDFVRKDLTGRFGGGFYESNEIIKKSGKFTGGKTYRVEIIGATPGAGTPRISGNKLGLLDTGGNDENIKIIISKIKNTSSGSATNLNANTSSSKDGVSYSGPVLASYKTGTLGPFLTPAFSTPLEYQNNNVGKTWSLTWTNVDFPEDGRYELRAEADDELIISVDDVEVATAKVFEGVRNVTFNSSKGKKTISMILKNADKKIGIDFEKNPVVFNAIITKKVNIKSPLGKPWTENPIGISAILIPPPCPRRVRGKGVVKEVIIDDPGNGYPSIPGDKYPVSLRLKSVIVDSPGINYNCGIDKLEITPNNGAVLDYECDTFGRIVKVNVLNPGFGFTTYPEVVLLSDTGVNARFRPQFEVIRDPITTPEKLIQVTDLVGLKQTGYVDGRPYYGSVFYKEGVRYAGFYETPGDLVQVYTTLKESIDAKVTTPASAIQRQGTDVTSNDPRLNIPNTPENLI